MTLWQRLCDTDHKVVGRRFLWLGLGFLFFGGLLALAIRWQLAYPRRGVPLAGALFGADHVISPFSYTTLFTLHGTVMIFFAITPILIGGIGGFTLPLLIGAQRVAFPRLGALSFWVQAAASFVLCSAALVRAGGPSAGWTNYPPLSESVATPSFGQTLWQVALLLVGISTVMGAVNYIATIVLRRAPGMTYFRMPLTVWGLWMASVLNVLFVPVLAVALSLNLVDRVAGTHFFLAATAGGGDPIVYQHLFWVFGHPEVYIVILPAWGICSDLISFFARKPAYGYRLTAYSLIAVCVLSSLVYGHHMFTTTLSPMLGESFMLLTMLISVPSEIFFLNWLHTLWRGQIRRTVPMLFCLGMLVVFGLGGLTGLHLAAISTDLYLHDSYFVVGHFHLTMAAAALLGAFAALYFWYPKMFGRHMSRGLGLAHFWLTLVPVLVVFGGMLVLGNAGMQRRLYDPSDYPGFVRLHPLNVGITHTVFVLFFGQLLFAYNFIVSLWRGAKAEDNPWQVGTLDWTTTSPPPRDNFATTPVVTNGPHELGARYIDEVGKDWLGQSELPAEPRQG